jgi:hypothetical protein
MGTWNVRICIYDEGLDSAHYTATTLSDCNEQTTHWPLARSARFDETPSEHLNQLSRMVSILYISLRVRSNFLNKACKVFTSEILQEAHKAIPIGIWFALT